MPSPDPTAPSAAQAGQQRNPWRLAIAAFAVLLLVLALAAVVFENAAAPHRASYGAATASSRPAPGSPAVQAPTAPAPLRSRNPADPVLAAVAASASTLPGPKNAGGSVFSQTEVWTRTDATITAQRVTLWRDSDGSGYVSTLTLADLPVDRFAPSMVGRTSFDTAVPARHAFATGQMPAQPGQPLVLSADPQTLREQLELIWPRLNSPADLLRAIAEVHSRYLVVPNVRAAVYRILASTEGITSRLTDIPTFAMLNDPTPGLTITAKDATGTVTLFAASDTGYLFAAAQYCFRGGAGSRRLDSYVVFQGTDAKAPRGW